jgi:hypothetical protein
MPDHRKPPVERGGRHEGATLPTTPDDSGGFSIESTTVRLKSMRLQRAENEKREFEKLAGSSLPQANKTDPNRSMWPQASAPSSKPDRPAGRITHDDRGVAVWDFAIGTGEFQALSQTAALKRLSIADLEIEDHKPAPLKLEAAGRDKGGGFDPYNQKGSGKREGEAAQRAGVTGAPDRDRSALDKLLDKK